MKELLADTLTKRILWDPVTTNLGFTFSKIFLEEWIRKNRCCPISKKPLKKDDLRKNVMLEDILKEISKEYPSIVNVCNYDELGKAIESNNTNQALELIEKLDIKAIEKNIYENPTSDNALTLACRLGNVEIVEALLKKGIDFLSFDTKYACPFIAAKQANIPMLELFFKYGLPSDYCDNNSISLLNQASETNVECVQYLIDKGCNPTHVSKNELSCVFIATVYGKCDVIKLLLQHNCDINCRFNGQNMLYYSIKHKHQDLVGFYMQQCWENKMNLRFLEDALVCFALALDLGDVVSCNRLIEYYGPYDLIHCKKPLFKFAINSGNEDVIRLLFHFGCDPTPSSNFDPLIEYVLLKKNHEILEMLVDNIERVEKIKDLMHMLIVDGWEEAICFLLKRKRIKNLNMTSQKYIVTQEMFNLLKIFDEFNFNPFLVVAQKYGESPLHTACLEGKFKMVKLLIEKYSCNPRVKDYSMGYPLDCAAKNGFSEIVDYLIERDPSLMTEEFMNNVILSGDVDFFMKHFDKYVASVNTGRIKSTKKMRTKIEFSPSENTQKDSKNKVNMEQSFKNGYFMLSAVRSRSLEMVDTLSKYNFDLNAQIHNTTPLIESVKLNDFQMLKELIKRGAKVHANKHSRNSPLIEALRRHNIKIIEYFLFEYRDDENGSIDIERQPYNVFSAAMFEDDFGDSLKATFDILVKSPQFSKKMVFDSIKFEIQRHFVRRLDYLLNYFDCSDIIDKHTGNTVLHFAIQSNNDKVLEYLYTSSPLDLKLLINIQNNQGFTPLISAIRTYSRVDILLKKRQIVDEEYEEEIEIATSKLLQNFENLLIFHTTNDLDSSISDYAGNNALHWLMQCRFPNDNTMIHLFNELYSINSNLLESLNDNDESVLFLAISNDNSVLVDVILDLDCNQLSKYSKDGMYPLFSCKSLHVMKTLLKYDGNLQYRNPKDGNSIFHYYLDNIQILRYLNKDNQLSSNNITINTKNDHGLTPLLYSIKNNVKVNLNELLQTKIDINISDNEGNNALMYAFDRENILNFGYNVQLIKDLVFNGILVDTGVFKKAIDTRNLDLVKFLCEEGFDFTMDEVTYALDEGLILIYDFLRKLLEIKESKLINGGFQCNDFMDEICLEDYTNLSKLGSLVVNDLARLDLLKRIFLTFSEDSSKVVHSFNSMFQNALRIIGKLNDWKRKDLNELPNFAKSKFKLLKYLFGLSSKYFCVNLTDDQIIGEVNSAVELFISDLKSGIQAIWCPLNPFNNLLLEAFVNIYKNIETLQTFEACETVVGIDEIFEFKIVESNVVLDLCLLLFEKLLHTNDEELFSSKNEKISGFFKQTDFLLDWCQENLQNEHAFTPLVEKKKKSPILKASVKKTTL
eukprot:TRINITY_DN1781_c0_g1_i1.p1 TRINITY_DN1781_c0_g1~~TRINITY_DN1781_c0_g1_i1.p1  ORF type:complete len:1365 (+),score=352.77 TRINITY_DN1781_c0_g1_i1:191-4285(+)